MTATASQFYFRFRFSVSSLTWEGRNLHVYQILAIYLSPPLRYYYFHLLETNVRHVGILLAVSIFAYASPSACHSASACQISSKSGQPRWSYDAIAIVKMAAVSRIELSQANCRPPTKCKSNIHCVPKSVHLFIF